MVSNFHKRTFVEMFLILFVFSFLTTSRVLAGALEPILEVRISEPASQKGAFSIVDSSSNPKKFVLKIADGKSLEFSADNVASDCLERYESLEDGEKEKFLKNRELLVGATAKILYGFKAPVGFMKKVGLRFSSAKTDEDKQRKKEILERTSQQVGADASEKMVREFERELWNYVPFVSKINEIGTTVEAGVAGGGKFGNWGAFVVLGVGVSINVDPKEKALVLELFQDVGWAKKALPGYVGAEGVASLFGNASYTDWREPLSIEKGTGFSLPGLSGCVTDRNARVGLAKGIGAGFPFAAVLTYSIVRIPLIRMGVSPNWPTFFRAKVLGGNYLIQPLKACGSAVILGCSSLLKSVGYR